MDEGKALKIRLTFSVVLVGISLMFAAVVTDHWAVLSHRVEHYNSTCEAAHFGLWRLCTKQFYIQDKATKERSCGLITLTGGMCLHSFHLHPENAGEKMSGYS
ncbi:chromosome partitioning protein [Platysternon megacephalum]|uniref:Chromosome partitioning protein n=1 Tax=Platysternon megacephalum TaxID=55544 RepID=A0A4D9DCI8_9SAUR|nr:chromosome partitioning protein [Platysternon megacephalum]